MTVSLHAPRPAWRHPVLTARHIRDGLRAWAEAHSTRHRHARPVGPLGWTARRIPVVDSDAMPYDRLALFHPKGSKYPFVQYDDDAKGRRMFLWAIRKYAYDRSLSNFQ